MSSEPDKRLTLVGVVHKDPYGEQRVLPLLEQLQCEAVSLEVSQYALGWRIKNGLVLAGQIAAYVDAACKNGCSHPDPLMHGELQGMLHMLTIPFEVRAAARYCGSAGAKFFLLDDSAVSEKLLSVVGTEMITPDNIKKHLDKPDFDYPESVEKLYEDCAGFLSSEPLSWHRLGLSEKTLLINEKRDALIEKRLRSLMDDIPGNWVHICGFTHLLKAEGFNNIAARFPGAKRVFAKFHPGNKKNC